MILSSEEASSVASSSGCLSGAKEAAGGEVTERTRVHARGKEDFSTLAPSRDTSILGALA